MGYKNESFGNPAFLRDISKLDTYKGDAEEESEC